MTFSNWEVVHRYNRLVKRGIAEPIRCANCTFPYITKIGPQDEPVFYCYTCEIKIIIGLRVMQSMREAIKPYFSEE